MKRFIEHDLAIIPLLGLIQGLLTALSLEPFNAPLTAWLMPWPFFYLAGRYRSSAFRLILAGASCSLFFCVFTFYWVIDLFRNFAGLGLGPSMAAFVPFAFFFNLQIPAFVLLFGISLRRRFRPYLRPRWFTAALLALISDYCVPRLFPYTWGNFVAGNRWMAQMTDLVGIYGLTPILFGISYVMYRLARMAALALSEGIRTKSAPASLKTLIRPFAVKRLWPMPLLLVLCLSYGAIQIHRMTEIQKTLPSVRVAIINPNAPPEDEKLVNAAILNKLMFDTIPGLVAEAARASGGRLDLIVLPESAVPFMCAEDTEASRRMKEYSPDAELMAQLLAYNWNADIFLNEAAFRFVPDGRGGKEMAMFNSSVLYSRDGKRRDTYQKRRLLAFGEYMPGEGLLRHLGLKKAAQEIIGASRFSSGAVSNLIAYSVVNRDKPFQTADILGYESVRGTSPRDFEKKFPEGRAFSPDGYFLPLICFESILPDHVRSFFNNPDKRNPDFIVNITQDGWYGNTIETYQHFALARIRAIETRRALVRSVNNGAAGFIDMTGAYVTPLAGPVMTAPETKGFQVLDVPINREMLTVYTRFGDWWMVVPVGVMIFLLICKMAARRE
ncbi:MAG: apolipoprotein N-acyltransferase [Spirochaetes bacterium]|nr:apolipoprotein N-acyltransferase [Spirochaetota bacterium]